MDVCGGVGAVGKVESNANHIRTRIEFEVGLRLAISIFFCLSHLARKFEH